ncbi:MAG: sigma-70 family RNA polymerase sigma factor [Myxococcota bacterium]
MDVELLTLQAIAAGDARTFGNWVAGAESSVRASLRPFAALVDTEAVVQEAFLRVWQVAPRFQPDGKPNALLRFTVRTARNAAISELRKAAPSKQQLDELEAALEAEVHVAPVTPDPLLRAAIAECRKKLPRQPGLALEQRLTSNGTEDDTTLAQRLGMSLNTFLQNFTRARKFLKDCLQRAGINLDAELSP